MKRSNYFFFGAILFVMLVIVGHYVTLYAMKQSGRYTALEKQEADEWKKYPLSQVNTVYIKGFEQITVEIGDSFGYAVKGEKNDYTRIRQAADRLELYGDTTQVIKYRHGTDSTYQRTSNLKLYITPGTKLIAESSEINLSTKMKGLSATISLKKSSLNNAESWLNDMEMLDLTASNGSTLDLPNFTMVENEEENPHLNNPVIMNLKVQLYDSSSLDDGSTLISKGEVKLSPQSHVSIRGENIRHVRLISIENL